MRKYVFSFVMFFAAISCADPLHEAIRAKDKDAIIAYLDAGGDINVYRMGMTPLDTAVWLLGVDHEIVDLLIHRGARFSRGKDGEERQNLELIRSLTVQTQQRKYKYYGGEYERGLFSYGNLFDDGDHCLWRELLSLGEQARVLDVGCGNCILALDLHSPQLNVDREFTMGKRVLRYWPGQKNCDEGDKLSKANYEECKAMFDRFRDALRVLRKIPPAYVGVSCKTLESRHVLENLDAFCNPLVRVLTGRFFADVPDEELVGGDKRFDIITDIFGAFTYSTTLVADFCKMLALLKVGGKVYIKTEPYYCCQLRDASEACLITNWLETASGFKVVFSYFGKRVTCLVIQKTSDDVKVQELHSTGHVNLDTAAYRPDRTFAFGL